MAEVIGQVEAIFRYPVKSMAGQSLDRVALSWHGLDSDRRFALRRLVDGSAFPWLSAGRLPELLLFTPFCRGSADVDATPTHVRTPGGEELPIFGDELAREIGRRHASPVEMMQLRQGIFDEASISLISGDTVTELSQLASVCPDARRFRPTLLVRLKHGGPYQEDQWVGRTLSFGAECAAPAIAVTMRDLRCSMVNLDPDTARSCPEVLKTVVRTNQNTAGIYCTVTRTGEVAVGQEVFLHAATE